MTDVSNVEWPVGTPIFELMFAGISEASRGNGVSSGCGLSATANAMEIQVASGTIRYKDADYSVTSSVNTVSASDATYTRWDTVVYDPVLASFAIRAGVADATPTPPLPSGDDVILGFVEVPAGATDITGANIYQWQVPADGLDAGNVAVADADAHFTASDVEGVLDEMVDKFVDVSGDTLTGTLSVGGNDLADGTTTLYDSTAGQFPRSVLDVLRKTTAFSASSTSGTVTTAGEEVLLVDSSSATATVTLASADVSDGRIVTIVDSGGASSTNAITVNTEGTETIDGASSKTLETDYGAIAVVSDGVNWFTSGSGGGGGVDVEENGTVTTAGATAINFGDGVEATDDADGTSTVAVSPSTGLVEGGGGASIGAGNQVIVTSTTLPNNGTLDVPRATLMGSDGTAVPTGVDLVIATLDGAGGYTTQSAILSGDGSTIFVDETGLTASYTNTSGASQTVAILVDNTTTSTVGVSVTGYGRKQ